MENVTENAKMGVFVALCAGGNEKMLQASRCARLNLVRELQNKCMFAQKWLVFALGTEEMRKWQSSLLPERSSRHALCNQ